MKNLVHLAILISCSVCFADGPKKVGDIDGIPEWGFGDAAALKQWSGSSSFGGGRSGKLGIPGKEVHWTCRSVTSGRASTELIFWMRKTDRILPCLIMPMRPAEYQVEQDSEDVLVKSWDQNSSSWREVLRLKTAFFMLGS
ncbi:MAG: hypothetical protein IAE97_08450 [Chthoniobacterales bacterium]|nr:hypothetical protein [Chthoniobacterales bacterium]